MPLAGRSSRKSSATKILKISFSSISINHFNSLSHKAMSTQITKQSVQKALHRNHFFVNSHYISNIIVIRNNQCVPILFPDTLIIFCNEPLSCTWHRYNVSLQPINNCIIKEGQYINAFKFGKLKNQDVFIQNNPITLVNSNDSNLEYTRYSNLIIAKPTLSKNIDSHHPIVLFENAGECSEFFSYCKVATSFNTDIFSLTIINQSQL